MANRVPIPKDDNNNSVPITPAVVALEETYDTTVSATTELTLNASTTLIEVAAISQGIFLKWGTSDVTSSDFDEFIPAGTLRHFYVPVNSTTGILFTAVNFIEQAASATLVVVEK